MARRWILTAVLAAVLVVVGVFAAHAIRDDDADTTRADETTRPAPTTTSASTTTAAVTTTVAPTTTAAPPTTTAVTTPATPPGPCGGATAAIRAAIDATVSGASTSADVTSCRLAPSDPSWAAVKLTARPGASFADVTVILHGPGGAWTVVAQGGPGAGCGQAPQQVIADLGQFCVSGGGAR